ncbi:MAG: RagB/SusD family nutrient uptake outer membrane protein, partial [Chitinophagaceae bacterium]|nr:RagB/SusD family nutrient uptake outer membrane protein [Chitinophagaceae bacterium]
MNRIAIVIIICLLTGISACDKSIDEFLDKAPGVDLVEDDIFSRRLNTEGYVSTLYQFGMVSIFPNRDPLVTSSPTGATSALIGTLSGATDESENQQIFGFANVWNSGNVQSNSIISNEDTRYFARWKAIRIANILLERIDEVPDADTTYRKQVKGEALFIRALQNFETLKRYGGFPIVNIRFKSADSAIAPRSTFEESVNAIIKDCDTAAFNLKNVTYNTSQTGRATRLAALALKSRTLLYAASPIFNTGTPYLSMTDPANNNLICYSNFDANRWKLAADAAMAVLVEAPSFGVSLIDVPTNRNPTPAARSQGNYWIAWEQRDNDEIIIADKTYGPSATFGYPWYHIVPNGLNSFITGNSVTHTFVSKYEDTLGNVPFWNPAGDTDLVRKYGQLDSRFKQSVAYNRSRWNAQFPVIETFIGATQTINNPGGAWMIKHIPEGLANGGSVAPSIALYRLNEFYLNYAE